MTAVLLDLEGTLFANGRALPGAADAVRALRDAGTSLRFLTNIDSRPPSAVAAELAGYGVDVSPGELFSPVTAALVLFGGLPTARVLPVVSAALAAELTGIDLAAPHTHVLVGDCRDVLDYPLLDRAFRAVRAGAELVALQRGRYFRRDDGDHVDTGAIVAGLEYAAGVTARVLGKPSPDFFVLAASSLGVAVTDCLVVGDDATTDIAGARAAGARAVQVRTGKFADQHAAGLTGGASATIDSVRELPALLAAGVGA
ncbi:MAG TPA: HAD-IA family hydrolase [Pseudonocardiaceae bacterium]|nr:HAD-IA family hydrolase [Pseudonocardiaceae bacterium]